MDFTVSTQGPTLAQLIDRSTRALQTANRTAGREIAKAGKKAMGDVAKGQGRRWYGRTLAVKFKVESSPKSTTVTFNPARGQAGAWAIADKGAGGHVIRPKRRRGRAALAFDGRYAALVHHRGARGVGTWGKAVKAVDKAVRPELEDVYDKALNSG